SVAIEPVTAIFMRAPGEVSANGGRAKAYRSTNAKVAASRVTAAWRCVGPVHRGRWTGPRRTVGGTRLSSVERVAAGAGAGRVRVVDGEALLVDPVDEVDRGAGQVGDAEAVDDDLDP